MAHIKYGRKSLDDLVPKTATMLIPLYTTAPHSHLKATQRYLCIWW